MTALEPVLREWCCGTPITSPHVAGCTFEPRPDNPIDYGGPAIMTTSGKVYAEHWPKIGVTLDYRGGLRYWAVVVELGGMVLPGEMDAFNAALKDAEAACDELNEKIIGRSRANAAEKRKVI